MNERLIELMNQGLGPEENILAPRFGVDAVAYGPGDSRLDHTPYEHINLKVYLLAVEVLKDSLKNLLINP